MIKTIIISFILLFLSINNVLAAPIATTSATPASNFTFPIKQLGDCKDLGTCTKFCEDPVNYNSCSDYAKKNGFYKDDQTTYAMDEFYKDAKKELSCDSESSCFNFCSKPENYDSCSAYAKRNELLGGYTHEPDKAQYVEAAKKELGCDSSVSCSTFCDNPANAAKCSEFAGKAGLSGGTTTEGPGGCQTPGTCGAYCSDPANYKECSANVPGGVFAGPGGCNSETSCRSYCDQNPQNCRSYAPGTSGTYVPVECAQGEYHGPGGICTKVADTKQATGCVGADKFWNGTSCQDSPPVGVSTAVDTAYFEARPEMNNCKTPGECYDYCKQNLVNGASVCSGFDVSGSRPTDNYTPYLYYTPGSEIKNDPIESMGNCTSPASCYDYCSDNPGKCEGFSDKSPRPPEIYIPGTYYTPPSDIVYVTPPTTNFYTTPVYYTPPQGSNYTTPQYYTPGTYSTPSYQTPPSGSNYTTPNYYTPWANYATPTGQYPTPTYATPQYYTPPTGSNYTTPYYYTPPAYNTPYYYTPTAGNGYTTPSYTTPPPYTTPQYYSPYNGAGYTSPTYYTPPTYTTPTYYTPPLGSNYTSPSYYTPPPPYTTPSYYTPGQYPTPPQYTTPVAYTTPSYPTPPTGSSYTSPSYYSPATYSSPTYYTPYTTPSYFSPPAGSNYTSPSYASPTGGPNGGYAYPTPGSGQYSTPGGYTTPSYVYPSPSGSGTSYYTPNSSYAYPSPTDGYVSPSYNSPYVSPGGSYSYPTPSYMSPPGSYGTPTYPAPTYGTPNYETPSYGTPSYGTPDSAPPPVQGVATTNYGQILQNFWNSLTAKFK